MHLTRPAILAAALGAALLGAGCSDPDTPSYSCPWHGTPAGITADDLRGDFTGGAGRRLHLDADGTFTTTGFSYTDWLSGTEITVPAGTGRWTAVLDSGPGVPVVDVPVLHSEARVTGVDLVSDGRGGSGRPATARLNLGGTREQPVVYESSPRPGDTCDTYSSMFRQQ